MYNAFALRAKWTRKKRKIVPPTIKIPLKPRSDDIAVDLPQYYVSHLHLARCWRERLLAELTWFIAAMRGELPPVRQPVKNYVIHHVDLPRDKYMLALEALTTRLGVKEKNA
jgi:hypothetical protein